MLNKKSLVMTGAALLAAAAMAPAAGADDGNECKSISVTTIPTPAGTYYIDDRDFVDGHGTWVYEETNGEAGLQRGGVDPVFGAEDVCQESTNPDFLIF